jgi:putative FmdB family regulatory protein
MPTYEYACTKCEHRFEVFHSIKDETARRCPRCRARARRVPAGGGGLLFRGSGFYITDYRSEGYRKAAKQEKGGGSAGKEGGDSGEKKGGGGAPAAGAAGGSGSD